MQQHLGRENSLYGARQRSCSTCNSINLRDLSIAANAYGGRFYTALYYGFVPRPSTFLLQWRMQAVFPFPGRAFQRAAAMRRISCGFADRRKPWNCSEGCSARKLLHFPRFHRFSSIAHFATALPHTAKVEYFPLFTAWIFPATYLLACVARNRTIPVFQGSKGKGVRLNSSTICVTGMSRRILAMNNKNH